MLSSGLTFSFISFSRLSKGGNTFDCFATRRDRNQDVVTRGQGVDAAEVDERGAVEENHIILKEPPLPSARPMLESWFLPIMR